MIKRCGWTVICLTTHPRPARYGWTCQELPPTGIAQRVIGVHKLPYHDKVTVHKEGKKWEVGLKHWWEVGLARGGMWTLNIVGDERMAL